MKRTGLIVGGLSLLLSAACQGRPVPAAPAGAVRHDLAPAAPTAAAAHGSAAAASGIRSDAHAAGRDGPARPRRRWWHPPATGRDGGPGFQWELGHPLRTSSASDMGGGARDAAGHRSPRPAVYDIDGIENPASTVRALHRLRAHVICYIEVGAAGNYYSARAEGIPVTYYAQLRAAGDLGRKVPGYPEYYLNINAASTLSIIKSMIGQQCARKGFDAVEPDIDDSYADHTGFRITERRNERFDQSLGAYAHHLGLAWGQKNGDHDPAFSAALEPATDFLLTEECSFYSTCAIVAPPYLRARKLVLDAEYTADWGANVPADLGKFCAADMAAHIDGTLFTTSLAGPRYPCRPGGRPYPGRPPAG